MAARRAGHGASAVAGRAARRPERHPRGDRLRRRDRAVLEPAIRRRQDAAGVPGALHGRVPARRAGLRAPWARRRCSMVDFEADDVLATAAARCAEGAGRRPGGDLLVGQRPCRARARPVGGGPRPPLDASARRGRRARRVRRAPGFASPTGSRSSATPPTGFPESRALGREVGLRGARALPPARAHPRRRGSIGRSRCAARARWRASL